MRHYLISTRFSATIDGWLVVIQFSVKDKQITILDGYY